MNMKESIQTALTIAKHLDALTLYRGQLAQQLIEQGASARAARSVALQLDFAFPLNEQDLKLQGKLKAGSTPDRGSWVECGGQRLVYGPNGELLEGIQKKLSEMVDNSIPNIEKDLIEIMVGFLDHGRRLGKSFEELEAELEHQDLKMPKGVISFHHIKGNSANSNESIEEQIAASGLPMEIAASIASRLKEKSEQFTAEVKVDNLPAPTTSKVMKA